MQTSTDYGVSLSCSFSNASFIVWFNDFFPRKFLNLISIVVFKHYTATMTVLFNFKSTGIAK